MLDSRYRRIALENHPDRDSSYEAREIFAKASEAYDVLSDRAFSPGSGLQLVPIASE